MAADAGAEPLDPLYGHPRYYKVSTDFKHVLEAPLTPTVLPGPHSVAVELKSPRPDGRYETYRQGVWASCSSVTTVRQRSTSLSGS